MTTRHPMRLCIHGHFYQPPRENPWTGEIEAQPSAAPHHDWNARIHRECYGPNGTSRLLDSHGRIRDILNNYRYLSFNFGPTLLDWMERHEPEAYAQLLRADQISASEQNGHGNALAQAYNHTILPLATDRDRRTQIEWGIRDFELRFGRKPEGMWLAETAINMDTVVTLIEAGIRFTVLAPTQAAQIRLLGADVWQDVSGNTIDPTRPYRIFPLCPDGEPLCRGHLDVFFYDGPIAAAASFEHLLRDANTYLHRLKSAWNPECPTPQLVHVATDGESYGHHEPFGDMALAYLFETLCKQHDILPTNYGHFLELCPPIEEVRLKNAHGEGTAWSCAHGTGRWIRDCGCHTGAPHGWNQKWRTPLRKAVNLLRDHAEQAWDILSPNLFLDPWKARTDWVDLHLARLSRDAWFARHLLHATPKARTQALQLLDLVRMGQFCQTSCGWFFNDISGLEPVQNLRYARRGCELLRELGQPDVEPQIIAALEEAQSCASSRNGAQIWNEWVIPTVTHEDLFVAHALFEHAFDHRISSIQLHERHISLSLAAPKENLWIGTATIRDQEFERTMLRHVLLLRSENGEFLAWIRNTSPEQPLESHDQEAIQAIWETSPIHLNQLLLDQRLQMGERRLKKAMQQLLPLHEKLAEKGRQALADTLALGIEIPQILQTPERAVIESGLSMIVERILVQPTQDLVDQAIALAERARLLGLRTQLHVPVERLDKSLSQSMGALADRPERILLCAVQLLLDLADGAGLSIDKANLENLGNRIRLDRLQPLLRLPSVLFPADGQEKAAIWIQLLQRLNFNVEAEASLLAELSPSEDSAA